MVSPGYAPADEPLGLLPEPSQAIAVPAPPSASTEAIAMAAIGRLALVMDYLLVAGVVRVSVCAGKLGTAARTTRGDAAPAAQRAGTSTCTPAAGCLAEVR